MADAVTFHRTREPGWITSESIKNPLPVAGVHLRGRRATVYQQSAQVLEFSLVGDDDVEQIVWMSVLRFVDTRRPGNAVENPTRTWAIGWILERVDDLCGMPVLARSSNAVNAWLIGGPDCRLTVSFFASLLPHLFANSPFFPFALCVFFILFSACRLCSGVPVHDSSTYSRGWHSEA